MIDDQLAALYPIEVLNQLVEQLGVLDLKQVLPEDVDIPLDEFGDEIPEEGVDFQSEEGFAGGIAAAVASLWRGSIPLPVFLITMGFILRAGLTAAWNQGAAAVGIDPGEFTAAELKARDALISEQTSFLNQFGSAIVLNARSLGLPLAPMLLRAQMWSNRFGEARAESMRMAARDQKLMWVWNPLKEHCEDCLKYNGRVYRGSVWQAAGIKPRSGELACGGFRCGCIFVLTDDPAMPGRPPTPSGI